MNPHKVMGGVTLGFRSHEAPPSRPPVSAQGIASSYLIGTYDIRGSARTLLHLINPTGKNLRVMVAFFDDNEKPLLCTQEKLSPNDLLERGLPR